MWYANDNYSKEEQLILMELEYDLFRCNPGLRAMWQDNFQEYFRGTLNEEYWKYRERAWLSKQKLKGKRFGFKDYECAHAIEEIIQLSTPDSENLDSVTDDPDFEKKIKAVFKKTDSKLLRWARGWADSLIPKLEVLYQESNNINCFRILVNAPYIPSKIVFASVENYRDSKFECDLQWRTDKIGYSLALASLRRCLESLQVLHSHPKTECKLNYKELLVKGSHLENLIHDELSKIILAVLTHNQLKD